jgi:hypothetical protein
LRRDARPLPLPHAAATGAQGGRRDEAPAPGLEEGVGWQESGGEAVAAEREAREKAPPAGPTGPPHSDESRSQEENEAAAPAAVAALDASESEETVRRSRGGGGSGGEGGSGSAGLGRRAAAQCVACGGAEQPAEQPEAAAAQAPPVTTRISAARCRKERMQLRWADRAGALVSA